MFIVVMGGSGCGKSSFAEALTMEMDPGKKIYIATMKPYDEEGFEKIKKHRAMRSKKNFDTIEAQVNLAEVKLSDNVPVLLECMSNLIANEMFAEGGAGDATVEAAVRGIKNISAQTDNFVVVTNNVFEEGDYYPDDEYGNNDTLRYNRYLAAVNNEICKMADKVYEVVCGIPITVR